MKQTYYRLRDKDIYIYGAGDMGKNVKNTIESCGKSVKGFIDRRAEDYELFQGKKVFNISEIEDISNKQDVAIILAFKNVYQHNEVAKSFQRKGFFNIVFKPLAVLYQCQDEKMEGLYLISKAHTFLTDGYLFFEGDIPAIESVELNYIQKQKVINEREDKLLFYAPVEMIFQGDNPTYEILMGKNMLALYPAVTMYRGFRNADSVDLERGVREYIELVAKKSAIRFGMVVNQKWENNLIEGRKKVYEEMKRQLSLRPSFFVENGPEVRFEKPFKLKIISSGKNRVSFLMAEGYGYIPVWISKKDYEEYINENVAEDVLKHIDEVKLAPIPHPYFYNAVIQAGDYAQVWLQRLGKEIGEYTYMTRKDYQFESVRVLDMLDDEGAAGRYLYNIGCDVKRHCAQPIAEKIDRLFHVNIPQYEAPEAVDVLLISSNCIERCPEEVREKVGVACYVLCWDKDEMTGNILTQKGFECKKSLFSTYWGGRYVEGEVWVRKKGD